jgi:hypothetical protein
VTNHKHRRRDYVHGEAFCLMTYTAVDSSGDSEVIWNSRDGVTPYIVALRDGREARHTGRVVRVPGHRPAPGSRVFVDLTPERAHHLAVANAQRWWALDTARCRTSKRWKTVLDFAHDLAVDYLRSEGTPDLIEVPEGGFVPAPPLRFGQVVDSEARTPDHYPGRGGW